MDGQTQVTCWCTRCESFHKMRMIWIGRGIPRKFCPSCKNHNEAQSEIIYPDPVLTCTRYNVAED